jgi:hypothetical protein
MVLTGVSAAGDCRLQAGIPAACAPIAHFNIA